uniref:RING-type E3 ubiquitin transferase n=1 Tax=Nicotiana tabacum TaxID=4097 RepID=A0A1S4CL23_TOBAC|nr:PREDICTED: E3 ubiquitin-protein ligase CHIP-like [Nicotiana tabacum]
MSAIVGSKQAEQLKQDGNSYFQKNRFGAAIDAYTEAITLCPNVPIYWTNRALCHRKRNDWQRVEEDCRKAIQLDHNSVKAHYYLGLALLQKEQYAEGVRELEKVSHRLFHMFKYLSCNCLYIKLVLNSSVAVALCGAKNENDKVTK